MEIEEEYYFEFSASLRIFGDIDVNEITNALGLNPTHAHQKGDRRTIKSKPYEHDMWTYKVSVDRDKPLTEHLLALKNKIGAHSDYLKTLKEKATVDIFCGYRSNSDTAGFSIDYEAFEIFRELEITLELSVIIA